MSHAPSRVPLLVCSLAVAAVTFVQAQSAPQQPFTPAQEATLDRLEQLTSLPDGPWKFHAGDVPHGESPTLDDSSWQTVQTKSKAGK